MQIIFQFFNVFGQGVDQGCIQILAPLLTGEQIVQILNQPLLSLGVHARQRLPGWQDKRGGQIFAAPLGVNIEMTHGVQLVAKELQTDGLVFAGGIDIHNAAPDSELAHALYHTAAAVARGHQPGGQIVQGVFFPGFQSEAGIVQNMGRKGAQAHGFPGHDLDGRISRSQIIQLTQPFLLPASGDHGGIIKGQGRGE